MHYFSAKAFFVNWHIICLSLFGLQCEFVFFLTLVEKADPHASSLLFCVISFKLQLAVLKWASIWIWCAWILIESFEVLGLNCRIYVWGRGRITEVAGQWQDQICIIQYPFVFFFFLNTFSGRKTNPVFEEEWVGCSKMEHSQEMARTTSAVSLWSYSHTWYAV